jgi:cation diffusion facilitator family transporter
MQKNSSIQWAHSHDFHSVDHQSERRVKVVFWLTAVVMLLEISAGVWSGSMALLADGWHMGTHSAAFLITLFAYSYARKHAAGTRFSFGTGKVNYLGGFASAIALAIVAAMMAIESIDRLLAPRAIHFNEAIIVAFVGLAVNIASVFVLHDDHHHHDEHDGHHHHDHNMKAAYFHVLADTLTSVLAIVALISGKYFGWVWMDATMGIVGSAVIGRWSYGLIKETSGVLLDQSVHDEKFPLFAEVLKTELNSELRDIHVWRIAGGHQAAIVSVATNEPHPTTEYEQRLELFYPHLSHVTIEIKDRLILSEPR